MNNLRDACSKLPIDINQIEKLIQSNNYSSNDLAQVFSEYVEQCGYAADDFWLKNGRMPEKHEVYSGFLYSLLELFLKYGIDLNYTHTEDSYIYNLDYVDFEYTSADCYRLLLENGLDPNIPYSSWTFFDELDSNVILDVYYGLIDGDDSDNSHQGNWHFYEVKLHCWLVFIGYGAKPTSGTSAINLHKGYSYKIFRQHEKFDFRIIHDSTDKDGYKIHIFERDTKTEVGVL